MDFGNPSYYFLWPAYGTSIIKEGLTRSSCRLHSRLCYKFHYYGFSVLVKYDFAFMKICRTDEIYSISIIKRSEDNILILSFLPMDFFGTNTVNRVKFRY